MSILGFDPFFFSIISYIVVLLVVETGSLGENYL